MSEKKSETTALLRDFAAVTLRELWPFARRVAIHAALGAVLLGVVLHVLIGEFWFGVKLGALLGALAAFGLRALFRDSFLG